MLPYKFCILFSFIFNAGLPGLVQLFHIFFAFTVTLQLLTETFKVKGQKGTLNVLLNFPLWKNKILESVSNCIFKTNNQGQLN